MNCNDARTLANRENAKKSTGPRTEEGKARSRTNALKHGLAGEGVAWPGEEAGELRRFVEEQVAAEPVPPRDRREQMLIEKAARIAWMLDRAERTEEARALVRASEAEAGVRKARKAEVAELVRQIEAEPGDAMEELLETMRGCRWVIDAIREMIDAVDADWWLCSLDERLDAICSPAQPGRLRISRAKALALALGSAEFGAIWPNGVPGLPRLAPRSEPEAVREWERRRAEILDEIRPRWRAELKTILARRLAEVERRLEELSARPDPAMELAAVVATFDASESSERLRRHIRSRERERRHVLAELEVHRARRDEHPNEGEPRVDEDVVAPADVDAAPGAEPGPLTPFEDRPPAALDSEGHGLNGPYLTEKWVRSGNASAEASDGPSEGTDPEVRDRR